MGFWGPGLYENDAAADVRDAVTEYWQAGKSGEEIISLLTEEFHFLTEEESPDGAFFWLGMADSLWRLGMLTEEVKEKAMAWLDKEWIFDSLPDRLTPLDPPMRKSRHTMLVRLRARLSSPQCQPKKYLQRPPRSCGWKLYDTYALPVQGNRARELGLAGRWLLLTNVCDILVSKTYIPVVYVKLTKDEKLPTNLEEFEAAEYVQVKITWYEDRFLPLDFSRLEEDIAEKAQKHYEVDTGGYLPGFLVILYQFKKSALVSDLTYVGHFPEASSPEKEFIPSHTGNFTYVFWKNHGADFEEAMIDRYHDFNLQNSLLYRDPELVRSQRISDPMQPLIQRVLTKLGLEEM